MILYQKYWSLALYANNFETLSECSLLVDTFGFKRPVQSGTF